MKIFYSPSAGGFYVDELHASIPVDAVEVPAEDHARLLRGQETGHVIVPDGDGRPMLAAAPRPSLDKQCARLKALVQQKLDSAAVTAGYDDIKSAVSYADESAVPEYQLDGVRFRAWRSRVWAFALPVINRVAAGEMTPADAVEALSELPAIDVTSPTET